MYMSFKNIMYLLLTSLTPSPAYPAGGEPQESQGLACGVAGVLGPSPLHRLRRLPGPGGPTQGPQELQQALQSARL